MMTIAVVLFETLYYSIFTKLTYNSRDKFWKYFVFFLISSVIFIPIMNNLIVYILYSLLYTISFKFKMIDFIWFSISVLVKGVIELIFILAFSLLAILNIGEFNLLCFISFTIAKFLVMFLHRNKINKIYICLNNKWSKDEFKFHYKILVLILGYIIIAGLYLLSFVI